jgi:hypothetical protein
VLQAGCKDENTTAPTSAPALSIRGLERAGARFSADVEIITGALVTGRWADWPGASSKLSYHVDQQKTAAGWRTRYSAIRTAEPDGKTKDHPGRLPALARVDVDELGAVAMYSETGQRLTHDDKFLTAVRGRLSTSRDTRDQTDATRGRLADMRAPKGTPPGRLSGLIVNQQAQQSIIDNLSARGRLVAREGSKRRYKLALAKGELEIAVDSALGAIVEVTTAPGAGPATHATYEYSTTPSGYLVRTRLRTERLSDGTAPPFISETRVSNVTVGEGGEL